MNSFCIMSVPSITNVCDVCSTWRMSLFLSLQMSQRLYREIIENICITASFIQIMFVAECRPLDIGSAYFHFLMWWPQCNPACTVWRCEQKSSLDSGQDFCKCSLQLYDQCNLMCIHYCGKCQFWKRVKQQLNDIYKKATLFNLENKPKTYCL